MSSGITAISGIQAADLAAHAGGRSQAQAAAPVPTQAAATAAAKMTPNPSLRIDSALAMVVTEFHGSDGKVENSIPTAQQLDAYRRSQGAERSGGSESGNPAQQTAPTPATGVGQPTADESPGGGAPRFA